MMAITDNYSARTSTISRINKPRIPCFLNNTFYRGRFWAHNRYNSVGRYDIAKPDVDELNVQDGSSITLDSGFAHALFPIHFLYRRPVVQFLSHWLLIQWY